MLLCLLLFWLHTVPDRDDDILRAIRILTGVVDTEQLDETEMERFSALAARPLALNRASGNRLSSSGLFSPYQLASLADYRSRNGDILSFAELACVDGFGPEMADALRPFITLDAALPPGALPGEEQKRSECTVLTSWVHKTDPSAESQGLRYGLKYRYTHGDRWALAFACRNAYGERAFPPSQRTGYALWSPRSQRGKLIIGSFHARFGEGLSQWSGFTLSDLSSVRSFSRRPTGLTPAWTYDPASCLHGLAGDVQWKSVQWAAYVTLPRDGAFDMGTRLGWTGRNGQFGVSVTAGRKENSWSRAIASLEGRCHIGGVDLFGEAAYGFPNRCGAFRGGMQARLGDGVQGGLLVRVVPRAFSGKKNGEYALSAGVDFGASHRTHAGSLTVDFAALPVPDGEVHRRQLKVNAAWTLRMNAGWSASLRVTERLRNFDIRNRTGIRLDLQREAGPWNLRLRTEAVRSVAWGVLGYAEGGWKSEKAWLWLRGMLFCADHWEDRIYSYERGAPGTFNVPARYGRGYALSAVGAWKFSRWGHGYLRAGWTGYFPGQDKPGKAEIYLVGIFSF